MGMNHSFVKAGEDTMKKAFWGIPLFTILILVSCSPVEQSSSNTPLTASPLQSSGNGAPSIQTPVASPSPDLKALYYQDGWTVTETVDIMNTIITVEGDLLVFGSGSLTLSSCTIVMKSTDGNPPRIEVKPSGKIAITASTVTASSPSIGYEFIIDHGASGRIENSIIEYLSPNDMSFGEGIVHEHANLGGLTILSDGFILKDNIIRNAVHQARAIMVAEAKDVVLEGNMIYNNPNDGIRLAACQNISVRNNLIFDNGTYGIKFMDCKDSQIANNIIRGNSYSRELPFGAGIYLEFSTSGVLVNNNQIIGNGRHGIVIPQSNRNTIDSNIIVGNGGYGVEVYGGSSENIFTNNILHDNRLEGIYLESGTVDNIIRDNLIIFPKFDGMIDDYEQIVQDDYWIQSFGSAKATFSFSKGAGKDQSTALRMDYSYSESGCAFGIFGSIGQDWSGYSSAEVWFMPDQETTVELEFAEDDGDVWFYNWGSITGKVNDWNAFRASLSFFTKRNDRSTGDGKLNLQGIGIYRLTVCPAIAPTRAQQTILFDNIQLLK
jgi:parallel beta-helix repeat protein